MSLSLRFASSFFAFSSLLLSASVASAQDAPAPMPPATTATQTSTTTTTAASEPLPTYDATAPSPVFPAQAGSTTPVEQERTESRFFNRPLFVTGLIGFGATYTASILVGVESDRAGDHNYLYYPVVGPWMDLANRDCTRATCGKETGAQTLLIADGITQGLGALMIVSSFFVPERVTKKWYLIGKNELTVMPSQVGVTGYGMGAHGVF